MRNPSCVSFRLVVQREVEWILRTLELLFNRIDLVSTAGRWLHRDTEETIRSGV